MSQRLAIGRAADVTLATTVKQILPLNREQTETGRPTTIVIVSSDVAVTLVTAKEATDGGAVPTSGAVTFQTTALPLEWDISGAEFLGLAGASAGTARIELR